MLTAVPYDKVSPEMEQRIVDFYLRAVEKAGGREPATWRPDAKKALKISFSDATLSAVLKRRGVKLARERKAEEVLAHELANQSNASMLEEYLARVSSLESRLSALQKTVQDYCEQSNFPTELTQALLRSYR